MYEESAHHGRFCFAAGASTSAPKRACFSTSSSSDGGCLLIKDTNPLSFELTGVKISCMAMLDEQ